MCVCLLCVNGLFMCPMLCLYAHNVYMSVYASSKGGSFQSRLPKFHHILGNKNMLFLRVTDTSWARKGQSGPE